MTPAGFKAVSALIIFSGLLFLSAIVVHYFHPRINPHGLGADSCEYWDLSTGFLKERRYTYPSLDHYLNVFPGEDVFRIFGNGPFPATLRLPGFPFLLSIFRGFFSDLWAMPLLTYVCYAGIALYAFLTGKLFFGAGKWALLFGTAVILSPEYWMRWGTGSDMLTALTMAGFTYHVFRLMRRDTCVDIIFAAIWGISAGLTHMSAVIFIYTFLSLILLRHFSTAKRGLPYGVMIVLLLCLLTSLGWGYRNYLLSHKFSLTNQEGPQMFLLSVRKHADKDIALMNWVQGGRNKQVLEQKAGMSFNQAEAVIASTIREDVLRFYKNEPMEFLKDTADGIRTFFMSSMYEPSLILVGLSRSWAERLNMLQPHQFKPRTSFENTLQKWLYTFFWSWRVLLTAAFFFFPLILLVHHNVHAGIRISYIALALTLVVLGIMIGYGSQRMRMAYYPHMYLFAFSALQWIVSIYRQKGPCCGKDQ